jgi:hypothetical protein
VELSRVVEEPTSQLETLAHAMWITTWRDSVLHHNLGFLSIRQGCGGRFFFALHEKHECPAERARARKEENCLKFG